MTPLQSRLARLALAGAVAAGGLVAAAAPGHAATRCAPDPATASLSPCEQAMFGQPAMNSEESLISEPDGEPEAADVPTSPQEEVLASLVGLADTYLSQGLLQELTGGAQAPR